MKLAIVGSRSFDNYNLLDYVIKDKYDISEIEMIISGAARGADTLGRKFAIENKIELLEFPAEWDKYGKAAGYIRNEQIIDACDECVCFWDGESRGTKHDIDLCKKKGKPCEICYFVEEKEEISNI